MTQRFARTFIRNYFGGPLKCQVLHQYTGEETEDSGWHDAVVDVDTKFQDQVHFRTGPLTTGVDNWIINAIERRKVSATLVLPPPLNKIEVDGEFFVDLRWNSGTGLGSDWKVHTLRSDDHDKGVVFIIRPRMLEIHSPSGISSTGWHPEFDIV